MQRKPKYGPEVIAQARSLAREGLSCEQVAQRLAYRTGMQPSTAWIWWATRGALRRLGEKYSPDVADHARALRNAGKTLLHIAVAIQQRFGVSPSIGWIRKATAGCHRAAGRGDL